MRDVPDFGPPEPPKEFAPCEHGHTFACPWPRCERGVVGVQLVRCGPDGARYFGRAMVARDGRVTYEWAERRQRRARRKRSVAAAGG